MKLSPAMDRFVLHWGEMGTRWGVNRSVAQVHALLYLAEGTLNAEEIADTLGIARSNVSTSLRELTSWNLVRLVHLHGDRRDHFEAEKDCWVMLQRIVEGRKQREIDPTLTTLRACVMETENDGETPAAARERLTELLDFMESLDRWYRDVRSLEVGTLRRLLRMGRAVVRLLPGGREKPRD
jgi:DNA-binding transcriptional regulator GbsR (MarR family)